MMVDEHPWDKNESFVIWPGLPYVALDPRSEGESRDLRRTQEDPGFDVGGEFHRIFIRDSWWLSMVVPLYNGAEETSLMKHVQKKGMHVQLGWCLKNLEFPLAFVFIDQLV